MEKCYKVKVKFGKDCKDKQRSFLSAMNEAKLISVSKEWIDIWYADEKVFHPDGYENEIVLHSDDELYRFKLIMDTFFKEDAYSVDEYIPDALETQA